MSKDRDLPTQSFTRRQAIGGIGGLSAAALGGCVSLPTGSRIDAGPSIRPGAVWLDTAGQPIQAHAGALIAVGTNFYWYGENKEFTDGKQGIESWGIRFYRSKNLYDWDDLGALIPPDTVDRTSPLSPKAFPERPHILFNPRTRKYVCWIKVRDPHLPFQYRTVLVADAVTGPYQIVDRSIRPLGMSAGDFDLVVSPDDHQAYMYFERDHQEVVCVALNDEWTNVTDRITRHFPGSVPPDTREGIACFRRNGKVYLTSSKMTGYFPNPSSVAVSDGIDGPFTDLGNLHSNDRSLSSFNSQISYIFKHPGKRDLFIALADRWLPDLSGRPEFESGALSAQVLSAVAKATSKPRRPFTPEEQRAIRYPAALTNVNTSVSRYVWLPILFRGGRPVIEWRDAWRIEDFD